MTTEAEQELKDMLSLIESMIAEGRRSTESWGWTFILWGVAYYVAIAWQNLLHSYLAWPVTMIGASILMGVIVGRRRSRPGARPKTNLGRAILSIWIAVGLSMFVLLDALGFSARGADWHISVAVAATLIGTANAASSMALKWKLQFLCALVWWSAAVVACLGSDTQTTISFLAAIFLCQIVFGIYGIIRESRERRQEAIHARVA